MYPIDEFDLKNSLLNQVIITKQSKASFKANNYKIDLDFSSK